MPQVVGAAFTRIFILSLFRLIPLNGPTEITPVDVVRAQRAGGAVTAPDGPVGDESVLADQRRGLGSPIR
ncbi:hypothetical protein ACQPYK_26510 [Streptosporangium sp. CA-135522]|uniref:hypothetical protein n=1 Tax=Streptosporangium sp. CA-135522 TaxID=3240072 RepID=UPI003D92AA01